MKFYVKDSHGRYYRSKVQGIKSTSFKWTTNLVKATTMKEDQAEDLVKELQSKGIDAKVGKLLVK